MKERPILFSSPMVRAILDGRKTQTRRVVKPQPQPYAGGVHPNNVAKHPAPYIDAYCGERATKENPRGMGVEWFWWAEDDRLGPSIGRCPYGQPGDRLWVRETWAAVHFSIDPETGIADDWHGSHDIPPGDGGGYWSILYADDNHASDREERGFAWRPSIHMPRWASRITLEVTGVRVERLQDISEKDAKAEGALKQRLDDLEPPTHWRGFKGVWESINGPGSWDANPWVWVVEFRRL